MPRVRLTDVTISKLPQQNAQITYWDDALPAFVVRVGTRRKTFIVILNGGRRIKLRIPGQAGQRSGDCGQLTSAG